MVRLGYRYLNPCWCSLRFRTSAAARLAAAFGFPKSFRKKLPGPVWSCATTPAKVRIEMTLKGGITAARALAAMADRPKDRCVQIVDMSIVQAWGSDIRQESFCAEVRYPCSVRNRHSR